MILRRDFAGKEVVNKGRIPDLPLGQHSAEEVCVLYAIVLDCVVLLPLCKPYCLQKRDPVGV